MCKRSIFLIVLIFLIFSCGSSPNKEESFQFRIENNNYWTNIAKAEQIFIINLSDILKQALTLNKYNEYDISIVKNLKGINVERIKFKIYMKEDNYNYIISLKENEKVIVFTSSVNDGYGNNNYLSDYYIENSILKYSTETEKVIIKEIGLQDNIIQNKLYENFNIDKRSYNRVNNTINNMTNFLFQKRSFKNLEKMGESGVPYIILLMDNFKNLPIESITLKNNFTNAFEANREYSPKLVIDALAAILNQITGESFGFIYNGDSTQEERILTLNGWRIYLYKLIQNEK